MVAYNKSRLFGLMMLAELALLIGEVLFFHQKLDAVHELIVLEEDIKEAVHRLDLEDLRLHLSLHQTLILEPEIKFLAQYVRNLGGLALRGRVLLCLLVVPGSQLYQCGGAEVPEFLRQARVLHVELPVDLGPFDLSMREFVRDVLTLPGRPFLAFLSYDGRESTLQLQVMQGMRQEILELVQEIHGCRRLGSE
jgi:hypothetical protein